MSTGNDSDRDGTPISIGSQSGLSIPRVTYLLSDLGGGTGHHLISLLGSPPAKRWAAQIVSEVENTARTRPPVPVAVLRGSGGVLSRFPLRQMVRLRRLRQRFQADPPDILHAYFFWSIAYARQLKASGIVGRLVENREDLGFNWSVPEYAFLRATRHLPDRIICVSDAVKQVVLRREGLPMDRLRVIHNGVALPERPAALSSRRLREELGIPFRVPIVGMVANYQRPIKGAVYFVDALSLVARDVPGVRFLLVGMGRNQAELQERANRAGVGDQVLFPGFRDDVDRFYDLMDVSALTSLSEGLSITILESMRHSVPVVATDVGGNRELVRDGVTGYLVPPRDVAAFARRVVELLHDPVKRQECGHQARRVVESDFNLPRTATAYGTVYEDVMRGV